MFVEVSYSPARTQGDQGTSAHRSKRSWNICENYDWHIICSSICVSAVNIDENKRLLGVDYWGVGWGGGGGGRGAVKKMEVDTSTA